MSKDRRARRLRRGSVQIEETERDLLAWVKCQRKGERRKAKRNA